MNMQFPSSDPKGLSWEYRFLFGGLLLFWTVENFILQSTALSAPPGTLYPYLLRAARFFITFLGTAVVVLIFNRRWLIFLAMMDCLLSLSIVACRQYFHHEMFSYYSLQGFKEGLLTIDFAVRIIPAYVWVLLVGALLVKILLICRITPKPFAFQWRSVAVCLLSGTIIILSLQTDDEWKFTNIPGTPSHSFICLYGYLITWTAESVVMPGLDEIREETIRLQRLSRDRIEKTEINWPVGDKIVIVQLESLDYNVINYRVNNMEVTPYLNRLSRAGRLFKLRAYHDSSTGDMDYAVLSGGIPSPRIVTYFIPDIPYANSLPRFLRQHGYHSVAWHGNDGSFLNRRPNYQRMGFDDIRFLEDLRGRGLNMSHWGIRDKDIFRLSSERMNATRGREFHFIISLDSHGPFDLIGDQEKEIFPHSRQWQQNYFNSMRVLDRDVGTYLESLPAGTLVILYGDHTSGVEYGDFHPARSGAAEYVPCILHVRNASWPGSRDGQPVVSALDNDLRINDVLNHLRRQIQRRGTPVSYLKGQSSWP